MDKTKSFEGFPEVEELDLLEMARKIKQHCRQVDVQCYESGCQLYDPAEIECMISNGFPFEWDL